MSSATRTASSAHDTGSGRVAAEVLDERIYRERPSEDLWLASLPRHGDSTIGIGSCLPQAASTGEQVGPSAQVASKEVVAEVLGATIGILFRPKEAPPRASPGRVGAVRQRPNTTGGATRAAVLSPMSFVRSASRTDSRTLVQACAGVTAIQAHRAVCELDHGEQRSHARRSPRAQPPPRWSGRRRSAACRPGRPNVRTGNEPGCRVSSSSSDAGVSPTSSIVLRHRRIDSLTSVRSAQPAAR